MMTKRFEEIAEHSHVDVVYEDSYTGMPSVESEFSAEKFAELMMFETELQLHKMLGSGGDVDMIVDHLRAHFGLPR